MSKTIIIAGLSLAGALGFAGTANAQLVTHKDISMLMAVTMAETAIATCKANGYNVSANVVGRNGEVIVAMRGDGTGPHTMEFARLKAYTSRTRNQTSLQTMKLLEDPANAFIRQIPNVVGVGGGVPIRVGNEVIGAVGVSGAPGGEKDEVCANAGIAKVEAALK